MMRDLIVEEVREARKRTEEACGHDWNRLVDHYREVEKKASRVIRMGPKKLDRGAGAAKAGPG